MARPFYVPDDEGTTSPQSSQPNSPTQVNNNTNTNNNINVTPIINRTHHQHNNQSLPPSIQSSSPVTQNFTSSINNNPGTSTSGTASSTTSSSSSFQQSPNNFNTESNRLNSEHLIQVLYEALYRIGGSPNFPHPPLSPSCSSNNSNNVSPYQNNNNINTGGHYGEIFFPRSASSNNATLRSAPQTPRTRGNQFDYPRRNRLSSTGEDDYEDSCYYDAGDIDTSSGSDDIDEHFNYMAARERLQMFPGRVPQRRKKKEQTFAWPTVVTAVVIAVGCGIFVTRN